jgi:uncharacterized membrane protein|tara:strand:- start:363 stop:1139 length:777 start_codon:yes stop_codon:yes gene_type:complete
MTDMTSGASSPRSANFSDTPWPMVRKVLEGAGWMAMAVLLFTGITSIFGRADFLLTMTAETIANPEEVLNPFDIRYYQHNLATWLHLGPGLLIFCIGPLQFMRVIRKKYINFHRWAGRTYIFCGSIGALSGGFIGIFYPFGGIDGPGFSESMATTFLAVYTLVCLYKAYTSIRRKEFGAHREWMIRSFGLMLAIATERVMLGILMSTTGIGIEVLFAATFWMAGVVNISASEIWISLTRTPGNGARHWKDLDAKATVK